MMSELHNILERLSEMFHSKFAVFFAWLTSGTLVGDGVIKKTTQDTIEQGLTLPDWQIIIGIVFMLIQILFKLAPVFKWIFEKIKPKDKQ